MSPKALSEFLMCLTDCLVSFFFFFFLMIYILPNNFLFETALKESVKILILAVHFLLSLSQILQFHFVKTFP